MNSKNTQRDYFEDEEEKRRSASRPRHKSERERLSNEETETFLSLEDVLLQERHNAGNIRFHASNWKTRRKRKKKETHSFGFDDDEYSIPPKTETTSPVVLLAARGREASLGKASSVRPSVRLCFCLVFFGLRVKTNRKRRRDTIMSLLHIR